MTESCTQLHLQYGVYYALVLYSAKIRLVLDVVGALCFGECGLCLGPILTGGRCRGGTARCTTVCWIGSRSLLRHSHALVFLTHYLGATLTMKMRRSDDWTVDRMYGEQNQKKKKREARGGTFGRTRTGRDEPEKNADSPLVCRRIWLAFESQSIRTSTKKCGANGFSLVELALSFSETCPGLHFSSQGREVESDCWLMNRRAFIDWLWEKGRGKNAKR